MNTGSEYASESPGSDDKPVGDLASEWGAKLSEAEGSADSGITAVGRKRSSGSPSANSAGYTLSGKDLTPFVHALGSFACRLAKVERMTADEAQSISDPGAAVLNKWAPNVAEWVPEMTLGTALFDFAQSRADQFREARKGKEDGVEGGGDFVEADEF